MSLPTVPLHTNMVEDVAACWVSQLVGTPTFGVPTHPVVGFTSPAVPADLISEMEIPAVALKYTVTKGQVQGLQERAGEHLLEGES